MMSAFQAWFVSDNFFLCLVILVMDCFYGLFDLTCAESIECEGHYDCIWAYLDYSLCDEILIKEIKGAFL